MTIPGVNYKYLVCYWQHWKKALPFLSCLWQLLVSTVSVSQVFTETSNHLTHGSCLLVSQDHKMWPTVQTFVPAAQKYVHTQNRQQTVEVKVWASRCHKEPIIWPVWANHIRNRQETNTLQVRWVSIKLLFFLNTTTIFVSVSRSLLHNTGPAEQLSFTLKYFIA